MDNFDSIRINQVNQELAGIWPEWTAVSLIGNGSFGTVYEIHRTTGHFQEKAALKVLRIPEDGEETEQLQGISAEEAEDFYKGYVDSMLKEIVLMQRLVGNSHIVSYEDYAVRRRDGAIGWDIYIRMELLVSLPEYLRGHTADAEMVLKLGLDITQGLRDCHRKDIIHRDIKPQNIFVNQAGSFKIGDFGLACFAPGDMSIQSFKGTVAYMAPEVFYQKGTDARSDLYSLGLVMYQCLNDNRLPFLPRRFMPENVDRARQMRLSGEAVPDPAHGPADLQKVVRKALEPDPRARYQTAEEMLAALEDIHRNRKKGTDGAAFVSAVDFYTDPEEEPCSGQKHFSAGNKREDSGGNPFISIETDRKPRFPDGTETIGEAQNTGKIESQSKDGKNRNYPDGTTEAIRESSVAKEEAGSLRRDDNAAGGHGIAGKKNRRTRIGIYSILGTLLLIAAVLLFGRWKGMTGSGSILSEDYAIDWEDSVLEARMRKITGIETGDIMYSDVYQITELDLSTDSGESEKIRDISALENLTALTDLDLTYNEISDISPLSSLTGLTSLNLNYNEIDDISPLSSLTTLTSLNLNYNKIDDISPLSSLPSLTDLDMGRNRISDISPLSSLTGLTSLYLEYNEIDDISPLSSLTGLTSLYLGGNQISDISTLSSLPALTELYIGYNPFSDISIISGMDSLTKLGLYSIELEDVSPLSSLTSLTELNLRDNAISDISPLSGLTALTYLDLSGNYIRDISPLSSLTALTGLDIYNNYISDISSLSSLTALKSLSLYENQIRDISPLSGLTTLTQLHLGSNFISDINALSNLTALTELTLNNNAIRDISPLSRLTALTTLNLKGNQIRDINVLSNMTELQNIDLSDNQIEDYSPIQKSPQPEDE